MSVLDLDGRLTDVAPYMALSGLVQTMPPAGGAPLTAQVKGNVVSLGAFPFDALLPGVKTENDLHVHETQIFFYNIKANVNKRVKAYLAQQD